jgi:transposase-like protein
VSVKLGEVHSVPFYSGHKGAFPNENSLMKLLYVGIQNASAKWSMPIQNWNLTLSQLAIYFEGRLDGVLKI